MCTPRTDRSTHPKSYKKNCASDGQSVWIVLGNDDLSYKRGVIKK